LTANHHPPTGLPRRHFNAMMLAAACPLPKGAHAQTQSQPYRVVDYDWVDVKRSRSVPSRLYWPSELASEALVPLVVFSHGIGGSPGLQLSRQALVIAGSCEPPCPAHGKRFQCVAW